MGRLALTISYDGTDFAGSQAQPGVRTVQGELEHAIFALLGEQRRTIFAGRTDRGVHAAGQVVGCADTRPDLSEPTIRAALNTRLPPDLAVIAVERMADSFHARYDARWREYRYRVWSGGREPIVRRYVWHRIGELDPASMDAAARRCEGKHDFASFAGASQGVPWSDRRQRRRGTSRTVFRCRCIERSPWWAATETRAGRLFELQIVADGFLPRMVRNLSAALVAVGQGKRSPEWIGELLTAADRRLAAETAPAHGLTFWRVGYDDRRPGENGLDPLGEVVGQGRREKQ
jgi:tRNA pseudouridine38-40 synthase